MKKNNTEKENVVDGTNQEEIKDSLNNNVDDDEVKKKEPDKKEQNKKKDEKTKKKSNKFKLDKMTKKYILGLVTIVILCVVGYLAFSFSPISRTSASAKLLSVLDSEEIINELNVLSIPYNGVYTKKENENDENSKILYYVAFKGNVKLGIDVDMKKMIKSIDNENFEIHITIPEVKITDCTVRADSLDYIYIDKSYDEELKVFDRKKECEYYLYNLFINDEEKKQTAKENVKSFIKGFFESIVLGIDKRYKIIIDEV